MKEGQFIDYFAHLAASTIRFSTNGMTYGLHIGIVADWMHDVHVGGREREREREGGREGERPERERER